MKFDRLALQQVDEQLEKIRNIKDASQPAKGWIALIRKALGLSSYQLARRLGVNQSRVIHMESAECNQSITLKTLNNVAQAMGCRLFYTFLPEKSLRDIVENQARKVAAEHFKSVTHSMDLEQQGLTKKQLKEQYEALVQEFLNGDLKKIWRQDV